MPQSDEETWAPVPGYEGLYEVSDQGRVRRLEAKVDSRHGPKSRTHPGGALSPEVSEGVPRVSLWRGGAHVTKTVARLVLLAHGPDPDAPTMVAKRIDTGGPFTLDNLRWERPITQAKLDVEQATSIYREAWRSVSDPSTTYEDVAERYGVHEKTVSAIKNGHTWSHVTEDVNRPA